MQKLETIEQYRKIITDVRENCKMPFSNNYFTLQNIQRYIELDRAYYYEVKSGVVFLFNEGNYYKACLYLDGKQPFKFPDSDKKVLVRYVYKEGKKDEVLSCAERQLEQLGFVQKGTALQVSASIENIIEKQGKLERYAKQMGEKGFYYGMGDLNNIDAIEQMLYESQIIKDYHIDYKTAEEKLEMRGSYMGIWNKNDELCAASISYISNGVAQGIGIAVKEKYKMAGFAPMLTYFRAKWLKEQGVKLIQGWVLENNLESLKYHKRLGYLLTGKIAVEWVKE